MNMRVCVFDEYVKLDAASYAFHIIYIDTLLICNNTRKLHIK